MELSGWRTSQGATSRMVASALAPLRFADDPVGLARAVCDLLASTTAVVCRIDLERDAMPAGTVPDGGLVARRVRPGRPDLNDLDDDSSERAAATGSIESDTSRDVTWIVLPLAAANRRLGVLRVALPGANPPASAIVSDLRGVAESVAAALAQAARHHEAVRVSLGLQESLLPQALPQAGWFQIAARYVPATAALRVGGDWYDAQLLGSGELALAVGDVAGHGVAAAARMGELRSAMSALRMVCGSPDELIGLVQRLSHAPGTFATAICARIDRMGHLRWSSAGHPHPVVVRDREEATILPGRVMPPFGAGVTGPPPPNEARLAPGDAVVLYTDGLVERRDETLDVSIRRLIDDVESATSREPGSLVDHVLACRQATGPVVDDIAVVVARLLPDVVETPGWGPIR